MQPEYQFAFEDILYEEIPSPLLQHADAMYEGEDYDPSHDVALKIIKWVEEN